MQKKSSSALISPTLPPNRKKKKKTNKQTNKRQRKNNKTALDIKLNTTHTHTQKNQILVFDQGGNDKILVWKKKN